MIPSRGDNYYQYGFFQNVLTELLAEQAEKQSVFYLIKDDSKNIIGRINLVDIDKEKKSSIVGYRVGESFIKKGIASKALYQLLQEAINIGIDEIHAKTTTANIGSQKVLIQNGFKRRHKEDDPEFIHYIWSRA